MCDILLSAITTNRHLKFKNIRWKKSLTLSINIYRSLWKYQNNYSLSFPVLLILLSEHENIWPLSRVLLLEIFVGSRFLYSWFWCTRLSTFCAQFSSQVKYFTTPCTPGHNEFFTMISTLCNGLNVHTPSLPNSYVESCVKVWGGAWRALCPHEWE